jgi:CO/xanthine dehydrogenase Mo-binding subunit
MAANLLAGQLVEPAPPAARNGTVGGDRNAPTNYTFPNNRVTAHWLTNSPLRPSALRSLGAMANVFANESFMDELAYSAGVDPLDFRVRHLDDPRAQAVLRAAADRGGWVAHTTPSKSGTGRGLAYARYENNEAYIATLAEVTVDPNSGQVRVTRVVMSHDCGLIVNPDGLTNQIEGNVIQATSRTLLEQVRFDQSKVTSIDWRTYPILRFPDIPQVEVVLLNHPDQPAYGAGEPSTLTAGPAIANAIFDASGARVRSIPLTADRIKAALNTA